MMTTLDDIKSAVSDELAQFEEFYQDALHSDNFLLDRIGRYTLKHKGKQLRPLFVFLSAKCFGAVNESTYRAATFIELLHSATLIHDDVVDDAAERRGFASINALYKNKIAVLAGDYLLSKGMMIALEKHDYQMLDMISETVKNMSEGEIFQLEKAKKFDISEDDYYKIIEKKTASMIGSCCAIGAVSTGASSELVEAMRKFGIYAGTAFQIRDDIFDYQPDNKSGKGYGNDIREHKMTLPLIHLLKESSSIERTLIISKIRLSGKRRSTIDEIIKKANEKNSLQYCEEKMNYFIQQADNQLNAIADSEAKQALKELMYYCVKRNI
ncbi:MAG: polyprenyl synthetase family protein [Bacteroidales bacterium]|nr:polyprenyl synthetase family protein [Bacteroidales bacterium]